MSQETIATNPPQPDASTHARAWCQHPYVTPMPPYDAGPRTPVGRSHRPEHSPHAPAAIKAPPQPLTRLTSLPSPPHTTRSAAALRFPLSCWGEREPARRSPQGDEQVSFTPASSPVFSGPNPVVPYARDRRSRRRQPAPGSYADREQSRVVHISRPCWSCTCCGADPDPRRPCRPLTDVRQSLQVSCRSNPAPA
jgi:hypothetical protein